MSHIGLAVKLSGWRRIRTFESVANRFTVCPLWPLGNPSKYGILAQLGEHLPYKQRVTGSSPVGPIYFKKLIYKMKLSNCRSCISTLRSSPRPISNSQLHVLPHFHLCPIYLVVFKGSYFFRMGYLILRGASRLDAFSVYPFRTWLPGHALGRTTGTPAVRPPRSSRTKGSPPQDEISHSKEVRPLEDDEVDRAEVEVQ